VRQAQFGQGRGLHLAPVDSEVGNILTDSSVVGTTTCAAHAPPSRPPIRRSVPAPALIVLAYLIVDRAKVAFAPIAVAAVIFAFTDYGDSSLWH
jgi:hypothetical protein